MRETRTSGSEGGGNELNRFSLPYSMPCHKGCLAISAPQRLCVMTDDSTPWVHVAPSGSVGVFSEQIRRNLFLLIS